MDIEKILFELCDDLAGGSYVPVWNKARNLLNFFSPAKTDALGNLRATRPGELPMHILLEAHLDEIGLVVTEVDEHGFLRVAKCGGVDLRVLPGARMLILADKPLPGVVCVMPPHLSAESEKLSIDDIYIDTGLGEKAKSRVSPGTVVVHNQRPKRLATGLLTAKSLDNRVGGAAVLYALELLVSSKKPLPTITVLLSNHEELGNRGAQTGSFDIKSDMAVCIDATFGCDKNVTSVKSGELGQGPMIGIAPVLSRLLSDKMMKIAGRHNIKYQLEIMANGTGTNAETLAMTGEGLYSTLLSIPIKNMHTAVEVVDEEDIENTAKLLFSFVMEAKNEN